MSYNPVEARWTTRDPIGFEGNDADLYRFAADSPVSATDPSGLIIDGGRSSLLGLLAPHVTGQETRILKALNENTLFQKILSYLVSSECHFKFAVDPTLSVRQNGADVPVPVSTIQSGPRKHTTISINPKFDYPFPNQPNPAEIANTILHELIHAVLIAKKCAKSSKGCPFKDAENIIDISNDPRIRLVNGRRPDLPIPVADLPTFPKTTQDVLKNEYGPEPVMPEVFGDLNGAAKDRIQKEVNSIIEAAGVGSPVVTSIPK